MPRVQGDSFMHVASIDKFVEVDEPILTLDSRSAGDVEEKIGHIIADLIKDGSTLQLGIGAIPNAVLSSLDGKKDIGIHTEMVTEGIVKAAEAGIITGDRKKLHRGKIVCTFAMGSKDLYDYINDNPLFEIHPVDYVNNPFIIAQNPDMIAINSAVSVDLTGQVCSDSIGSYIYSGFGGQLDFIRGATESEGGVPDNSVSELSKTWKRKPNCFKPCTRIGNCYHAGGCMLDSNRIWSCESLWKDFAGKSNGIDKYCPS